MTNTIDANCWCKYVEEKIAEAPEWGESVFAVAETNGGVLLDDGGLCKQQYIMMKKPYAEQLFDSWAEAATLSGRLKLVDISGKNNFYKELTDIGIPKGEHIFFRVSIHGDANYLVSADSDFFDPAMKGAGAEAKMALLASGKGPVCKHMKKNFKVTICSPLNFIEFHAEA